ncbi:lysylphosphatidylglycerol synthase transmembrane domain-containing protein [Natrarchaeobius sp. A-rgal3]|uniref:lysylphosphatidylglycerol synthase transmembrane domain-containing protein n=1 Tax=Natrarchaeobius versutus TaxID=1679078 RepID=UPI0035106F82
MRWRRAVGGLTIAVVVVALLMYSVGWSEVVANVRTAHPVALTLAVVAGFVMLALRGLLLRRLLEPVSGSARGIAFGSAFLSGYFARSALPWGRSTGTPITAYLLSANSDSEFEDNLAAVAATEGFNVLGSLIVAVFGFVAYAAMTGATANPVTRSIAVAGGGGLVVAGVIVVVFHQGVARTVSLHVAQTLEAAVGRVPRLGDVRGTLTGRIEGFFATLETIQASRRTLAVAFGITTVGWVFNALPLYFSLLALGVDVPLALVLVCAPLASFGGVVPLPGGSGGIEVVLASLLVATAGVSGGVATAAAILYRLTTYWTHLAIAGCGAAAASVAGTQRVRT